jgi:hypothetical protein
MVTREWGGNGNRLPRGGVGEGSSCEGEGWVREIIFECGVGEGMKWSSRAGLYGILVCQPCSSCCCAIKTASPLSIFCITDRPAVLPQYYR